MARKLILAGTNLHIVNKEGLTALDFARQQANSGVTKEIEEAQEQRRRPHRSGKGAHSGRRNL